MQLTLSKNELGRLGRHVEEDYNAAIIGHDIRIERFRGYYQRWRNRVDAPRAGEEDEPNFSVPMTQWNVLHKWADDISKLLGSDAEIVAKATGPSDQRIVHKVGRYETWRVFQAMKLVNPFAVFTFRKNLFGRAHAYAPWVRDTYPVWDPETGQVVEKLDYEGPGFFNMWPDAFITAPETNVESLHDFSYVIRRYRARPADLLRGEKQGRYQGISERFEKLVQAARLGQQREGQGEEIQEEKDLAEGVTGDGIMQSSESLVVLEWYGWWRRIKGKKDASETNLRGREREESELVVRCLPELNYEVVGVQDLMDLYPTKRRRRPFVECSLIKDGSYWNAGLGELLESIEDEATVDHQLFTKAGMFSVGPVIFYKPSSGFDPETFEYRPYQTVPTEDPAGVRVVSSQANLQYPIVNAQTLSSYAEKVTGNTDFSMGQQSDRPNAPRTARGTLALLEQGNIRANLDTTVLREDMGQVVSHFWELEQQFPISARTFFRVTEEEARGLFPTAQGGAYLEPDEMGGRYDFQLKFATSVWSREAEKERNVALYQLDLQNPLIMNDPRALWMVTQRVHKALGDDNFADLVPEPPAWSQPRKPREEWTLALEGEPIEVHPDDHDQLHIREHVGQIREERGYGDRADGSAIGAMLKHIEDHQRQHSQKLLRQVLANQLVQVFAQRTAAGQPVQPGQPPANVGGLEQVLSGAMQPAAPGSAPGDNEELPPLAA